MAYKTQGTQLYAVNLANGEMVEFECVDSVDGIDSTVGQIETSCMKAKSATYDSGRAEPGTATISIRFDPRVASDVQLYNWKARGAKLRFLLLFGQYDADGGIMDYEDADQPTVSTTDPKNPVFEIPVTRPAIAFDGHISGFPFNFAQNGVVSVGVQVQISGDIELIPTEEEEEP